MTKPIQKTKVKALQACQSLDEVQSVIALIGEHEREIERLGTEMNDKIAVIAENYASQIQPLKLAIDEMATKAQIWCEANRATLLKDGGKTAKLITGEVSWRQCPPSIKVRGTDDVIARLERFGLDRFIRTKKSIDKEAIANEPTAVSDIEGITIVKGVEMFKITPFEIKVK